MFPLLGSIFHFKQNIFARKWLSNFDEWKSVFVMLCKNSSSRVGKVSLLNRWIGLFGHILSSDFWFNSSTYNFTSQWRKLGFKHFRIIRVFFYNSHRVKSSLLSLELSFRGLLLGRQISKWLFYTAWQFKLRVSIIKKILYMKETSDKFD